MKFLVVLGDPPYGTERSSNGLRLAGALSKRHGGSSCATCMGARGLANELLVEEARRSTLEEATDWTIWADKVVTF